MSTTIRDVAREAGISIATVSRVINNSPDVTDTTKRKVEQAIIQTGYTLPASSVRSLQKAMRTIGLLMSDINNLHFPAVIRGMDNYLFNEDYSLFVCNTDQDPNMERRYIETLTQKGVDGIIFLGTRLGIENQNHIIELSNTTPVLTIDDYIVGANVYSVMVDETEGAYQAVSHLLSLGHRKIAFIRGDGDYTTNEYKYSGYQKAFRDHGIPEDPSCIIKTDPHERGGYEAGKHLTEHPKHPTAVFAVNDQIAIGVMRAVHEKGLSIPKDFSIIGFSDIPIAAELFPPLTSVNQFSEKIGALAAKTILQVGHGEQMLQRRIILQPELSIRQSTGPVPH